eukprot:GHVQ01005224.1.p1 GENE.GHVQ01005224.1~~GHVQ01005224.1.p1  ORF type:complete len:1381 (+),score=228.25 GHVQ01005224.1:294-4436(+)
MTPAPPPPPSPGLTTSLVADPATTSTTDNPTTTERRESIGTMFSKQIYNSVHIHSAGVCDKFSPLQLHRQTWEPTLPLALRGPVSVVSVGDTKAEYEKNISTQDRDVLSKLFPNTWGTQSYVQLQPCVGSSVWYTHQPMRVGVVLSGGQAPGGHNVISGVYDYVKQCNANSQLFGFIGGPHGIFSHEYVEIQDKLMDRFRNQGGFDMIRSGRHKIETEEQKTKSLQICQKLDLHGLIVIGGDDSNTNAAIIAEYFKSHNCNTKVIGCPKTIDGDLRNEYVEASFGFDTAVKTYSEFVGNLCEDIATSGRYYHFVRLMGRSASHLTLEVALQTRPNLTFIGEEVQAKQSSLKDIVNEVVDMIVQRHKMGRDYGVVLLPEGLIEFIPEVGVLISEINSIMGQGVVEGSAVEGKLTGSSKAVFDMFPESIKNQLLLDRDPHGNVQVAMIATERLLVLMVQAELQHRGLTEIEKAFTPFCQYFGYEGRCGMPSVFDANYCYALGHTAAALVDNGCTGCMAVMKGLKNKTEDWIPGGCPLTLMMNIETRKGKATPVIKKYLVELDNTSFVLLSKVREEWKYRDLYRSPGPIQFEGPVAQIANHTITPPIMEELLPAKPHNYEQLKTRHHFVKSREQLSPLQRHRLEADSPINPMLKNPSARCCVPTALESLNRQDTSTVNCSFPLQTQLSKNLMYAVDSITAYNNNNHSSSTGSSTPVAGVAAAGHMVSLCTQGAAQSAVATGSGEEGNMSPGKCRVLEKGGKGLNVGVVLTGQQAPGCANVVCGLFDRLQLGGSKLIGFHGAEGVMSNDGIELTSEDIALCRNQGGFGVLGRTAAAEPLLATAKGVERIKQTCIARDLDGLVMMGGCWTLSDCGIITEAFLLEGVRTRVIGVPCTQNNNIDSRFIECTVGFDSASKCYSQLIGNLLTDAASATKYWYFVRLMGRDKSHMVVEAALQTHSNVTLVSELLSAGNKTLQDVVVDVADTICARAERGKNFGAVLIPEGLITELPQMRQLLSELMNVLEHASDNSEEFAVIVNELVKLDGSTSLYSSKLTSWSWALLKSLPEFIRKQLVVPRTIGRIQHSKIASEEMLSQMVGAELQRRKNAGGYSSTFSPVCFYFGYQARSSLPSVFDSSLGLSHGYLSAVCIESGLTGYVSTLRGLCGSPMTWRPVAVPISCLLRNPPVDEKYAAKVPMVISETVRLNGKALGHIQSASRMWEQDDRFCNPGPMQFYGDAMFYYTRYLFEQQHDYLKMLALVCDNLSNLQKLCTFGVDELTLSTTYHALEMVQKMLNAIQVNEGEDRHAGYTTAVLSRAQILDRPGLSSYIPSGSATVREYERVGCDSRQMGYLEHMAKQCGSVPQGKVMIGGDQIKRVMAGEKRLA